MGKAVLARAVFLTILTASFFFAAPRGLAESNAMPRVEHTSGAYAGWHWLNPLPNGNFATAVACAPDGPCFAVGADGLVIITRDKGRTWVNVPSGRTADLFGITCPTRLTCYAVSNSAGAIFTTTDGARSWTAHFLNRTWGLYRLSCPGSHNCYALGTDYTYQCHVPNCNLHGKENVLVRTADDGRTWQRLNTGDTDGLYGIACPITRTCYLAGGSGTVLVTRDSGASWHRLASRVADPHVTLHSVACPSTRDCLIGGDGVLLATHDYGGTWRKIPPPPGVHFGFTDLTCANSGGCLGLGSSEPPKHRLYQDVLIAVSTAHNRVRAMVRGIVQGQSIACSDPADCQVAGGLDSPSASNDGGRHWRDWVHGDREELDQIVCPTVLSCRTVGKGHLLVTDDGGKSWTSRGPVVGDDYGNGSGLFCLTARICYAGRAFGRILKTRDGGRTWQREHDPLTGTAVEFSGITCPAKRTCFAAGSGCRQDPCRPREQAGSVVVMTGNGGASWREVYHRQREFLHLSSIACPSVRVCYAAGSPAFLAATKDGGASWHELRTPAGATSVALSHIACASTRVCVAVGTGCTTSYSCAPQGFGSVILRTANAGSTWHETVPPLPASDRSKLCDIGGCPASVSLSTVACPTTQRCWVVGAVGTILRTVDGGVSWQQDQSGTDMNLRGVACPGIFRCYTVGEGGAILGLGSNAGRLTRRS